MSTTAAAPSLSLYLLIVSVLFPCSSHPFHKPRVPNRAAIASSRAMQVPLIINEYLSAPPAGAAGDANGDGSRSPSQDEFVELVNTSSVPLDVSGFTIGDAVQTRFTFPTGKVIPAGEAAIVFGGGTPTESFGNCRANGLVFTAGSGGLSLNDSGDSIIVRAPDGAEITRVTYPPPVISGQSATRSPDVSGAFAAHLTAPGASGRLFSPGTRTDGSTFTAPVPFISSISPQSAVVGEGPIEVIVSGGAFDRSAQAFVDGEQVATVFESSTQLVITIPAAIINGAGTRLMTVKNAASASSNGVVFTILARIGLNELLADPPGSSPADIIGDANGDGIRDSADDEFVEVVNRTASPIEIGGYSISDQDSRRFTFPPGTLLPAGEAAVVFGGGTPRGDFGNAAVNGLIFTAPLSLNNGGDTLTLKDAAGQIVETIAYGPEGGQDDALNRSPEIVGTHFAKHSTLPGAAGRRFSPGVRVDGTPFSEGPRISSIEPDHAAQKALPFEMSVKGTGFQPGCSVFADSMMLQTEFQSSTQVTARVPDIVTAVAGQHRIVVRNPDGNRSNDLPLRIEQPPPELQRVVPRTIQLGSRDFTLFVEGDKFDAGARVMVEGSPVATSSLGPRQLRATVPASFAGRLGEMRVSVRNTDGKESSEAIIEIVLPFARISSLAPAEAIAGQHAITLAITGANFVKGAQILFDRTVLQTRFVSSSRLEADLGTELLTTPGLRSIVVQNVDGSLSNEVAFEIRPVAPLIYSVEPPSVISGGTSLTLALTGNDFRPGARVFAVDDGGGSELEVAGVDEKLIRVVLPAELIKEPRTIGLRVMNTDFGVSNTAALPVLIRDPLVINEYLADPPPGAEGDANGDGTRSSSQDEFVEILNRTPDPIDISGYTLSDSEAIRHVFRAGTIVPPFEAVIVFGGGSPRGSFGNAAENKLVFTASSGGLSLNNSGDTIRLKDAAGRPIQEIRFGIAEGSAGQSLNRDPDGDGAVFVPHRSVAEEGRAFSPGTRATGRAFTTRPRISALAPSGIRAGSEAFVLRVSGTNFLPGAQVLFGGRSLTAVLNSDTELMSEVAEDLIVEAGAVAVQVRNPRGELSSEEKFVVIGEPPKLVSLSPTSVGTMAEQFELTVEGENFQRKAAVILNGTAVETSFVSDAKMSARLPDSLLQRATLIQVQILNEDGNRSNALELSVENGPLITRLSRSKVRAGSDSFELVIGGVAFASGVVLLVDGSPVMSRYVSENEFAAVVPRESLGLPGNLTLQALNRNGGRSNRVPLRVIR